MNYMHDVSRVPVRIIGNQRHRFGSIATETECVRIKTHFPFASTLAAGSDIRTNLFHVYRLKCFLKNNITETTIRMKT